MSDRTPNGNISVAKSGGRAWARVSTGEERKRNGGHQHKDAVLMLRWREEACLRDDGARRDTFLRTYRGEARAYVTEHDV